MDIGDYIFFFIFILVIIGRVLSWIFKQFVVIAPDDNAEKKSSRQHSMKDKIIEWIRSLEERIEANQWNGNVTQSTVNDWERIDPHEYYDEPTNTDKLTETPPIKHAEKNIQSKQTKTNHSSKKQIPKKVPLRRLNLEKAMIHHEILSPPLSLRQENPYVRQ